MSATQDPEVARTDAGVEPDLDGQLHQACKAAVEDTLRGGGVLALATQTDPRAGVCCVVATVFLKQPEHPRDLHALHVRLWSLLTARGFPASVAFLK